MSKDNLICHVDVYWTKLCTKHTWQLHVDVEIGFGNTSSLLLLTDPKQTES